jgi:hypothetical protein
MSTKITNRGGILAKTPVLKPAPVSSSRPGVKYRSDKHHSQFATIDDITVESTDQHIAGRTAAARWFSRELGREVPSRDVAIYPSAVADFDGVAVHCPVAERLPIAPSTKAPIALPIGHVTVRSSGGNYFARCGKQTASSTNDEVVAAARAAGKHFGVSEDDIRLHEEGSHKWAALPSKYAPSWASAIQLLQEKSDKLSGGRRRE